MFDLSELLQTSSAKRSVLWAGVERAGRISYRFTGNPRTASCHAASLPASPPPAIVTASIKGPSCYSSRNRATVWLTLSSSHRKPMCPQSESSSKVGAEMSLAKSRAGVGFTTWSLKLAITRTFARTVAAAFSIDPPKGAETSSAIMACNWQIWLLASKFFVKSWRFFPRNCGRWR